MKRMFCIFIAAMVAPLLGGCFGKGTSANPPANFTANAGDGRVILTWDPVPNVDFWIFTATVPSLTAFNWTGLPNAHAYIKAATPFYLCGLYNGTQYYFAANGRTNGGPGGTSSPTITTTNSPYPYNASAVPWTAGSTSPTPNLLGAGYTGLTTCSNNATSAAGIFAAVGQGGAIFTSNDGKTWTTPTSVPSGPDLYAVTGYAANQNNPTNPSLLWIAVGAGGNSIYSTDLTSDTWTVGGSINQTTQNLHSITHNGGTFVAVGDAATILSTTDGITWTPHPITTVTSNNLNGVTHGTYYVAVGDSGTILTSADGNTWSSHTATPDVSGIKLQQVAYHGSVIVAVGDSGTIVTSKDNGSTWSTQTLPGSPSLVGVTAETLVYDTANATANTDAWLAAVPIAQFVILDSTGKIYSSMIGTDPNANGLTWSGSTATGISNTNALVSSGFGFVAAGNAGATAYAF